MTSAEVYSYFECDQLAIKVAGDNEYTRDDCVGSLEVERETKTVTKSCRGVVEGLQPGIYAWDNTVPMPEGSVAARVKDEDDNIMFLGYPRCKVEELNTLSIENGAEEVAEVEIKLSYMPDDYNKGEYQALADELTGDVLTPENWMTTFSSETAQLGS